MSRREPDPIRYDFTKNEVGFYTVIELGWWHTINTLADLVEDYDKKLTLKLREAANITSQISLEAILGIQLLQVHTEPGIRWTIFRDGGLALLEEEKKK